MPPNLENSAVATGLEKVSFHSNPKERQFQSVQTIAQLHSSQMLAQLCSKLSNGTWNENLQMFTLDLEKSKEQETKLPTSTGSKKKQENSRKNNHFCFIDRAKDFDCMDHNKLGNSSRGRHTRPLTCLLRNLYTGQEAIVRIRNGTVDWFQNGKEVLQGCILSPYLFNFYAEYIMQSVG